MIFFTHDKLRIHCKSELVEEPKADILLIHGLGEHSGRYNEFSKEFTSASYNVHRMDLRGHGCSEGLRGYVSDFSQFHRDLELWCSFLSTKEYIHPRRPLFVFAHSLGGLIILDYFLHSHSYPEQTAGIVLSSPAVGIQSYATIFGSLLDVKLPSALEQLHFHNGIEAKYLSHEKKIVDAYLEDPLVHNKITIRLFRNMMKAIDRVRSAKAFLHIPILIFAAGEDRIVDPKAILKFAKMLKAEDKSIRLMKGFYHEVFQEKKREKCYQTVKQWFDKCLKNSSKLSGKKVIKKVTSLSHLEKKVHSI